MTNEPEILEPQRIPRPPFPADSVPGAPHVSRNLRAAWILAIVADFVQWIALPLFAPGAMSPFDPVLDVAVAVAMVRLLGWHWAFLPTFVTELIPFVDLVPTWTLAVWLARKKSLRSPNP